MYHGAKLAIPEIPVRNAMRSWIGEWRHRDAVSWQPHQILNRRLQCIAGEAVANGLTTRVYSTRGAAQSQREIVTHARMQRGLEAARASVPKPSQVAAQTLRDIQARPLQRLAEVRLLDID